jgi:hypothetical protein
MERKHWRRVLKAKWRRLDTSIRGSHNEETITAAQWNKRNSTLFVRKHGHVRIERHCLLKGLVQVVRTECKEAENSRRTPIEAL